ncbi:unnamed protein product [Symbiodinium sp. CCMP2592]|nr:unnamed protein product [Symbiodinium sp. CCMP2592]
MVALGIELLALLLLSCAVPGRTSWLKTIDVAGFQRTLVQKMTKELLLVALDIDPDDNKRKIHEGIAMFDQTLHDMIEGSDAGDIVASPSQLITDKLEEVDDIWHVFEHVVLSNIDTISNMNGTALEELLQVIAEQSNELLSACGVVVGALSDVATLLGFATMGLQQDIAGRQRSYVQMMCKEALFVSLGINVAEHVEILKHTKLLFEASHEGIIVGDSYVGIPVLSSLCTLHQMREVTYSYHNFRPYVMDILNANSNAAGQAVAKRVVRDMMNTSETLFSSMVDAVQLFVNGSEDCDPRAKMVESDWLRYLENLGRLRLLIQQVSMFFAQVASDVEPAAGKVELTVLMAQASQMLRNLIEGSKAESIPAPPTQEIVLQLQHAWEDRSTQELVEDLERLLEAETARAGSSTQTAA